MTISKETWLRYVNKLAEVNAKASQLMIQYVQKHGFSDTEELIATAFNLADYYGEAAAAAACDLYDAIAAAEGVIVPPAVPAQPATYGEVAKAVQGTMKKTPNQVPQTVGRLVKQTGADTMLQNAQRDGAQFAWIPHGDTCAFCMTLASRGWQYMSKKTLKNGHAEHIHANCNCEYCVRFDGKSEVEGYDPDEYKRMYDEAEGSTPQEKINSIRREIYAKRHDQDEELRPRVPDFYVGRNGKVLPAVYRDWIGDNQMQELLDRTISNEAKSYIITDYRKSSFIGNGNTASIRKFELATGLNCGRNGRSHSKKVQDLINKINKTLLLDLPESDRIILEVHKAELEGVNR